MLCCVQATIGIVVRWANQVIQYFFTAKVNLIVLWFRYAFFIKRILFYMD